MHELVSGAGGSGHPIIASVKGSSGSSADGKRPHPKLALALVIFPNGVAAAAVKPQRKQRHTPGVRGQHHREPQLVRDASDQMRPLDQAQVAGDILPSTAVGLDAGLPARHGHDSASPGSGAILHFRHLGVKYGKHDAGKIDHGQ